MTSPELATDLLGRLVSVYLLERVDTARNYWRHIGTGVVLAVRLHDAALQAMLQVVAGDFDRCADERPAAGDLVQIDGTGDWRWRLRWSLTDHPHEAAELSARTAERVARKMEAVRVLAKLGELGWSHADDDVTASVTALLQWVAGGGVS